MAGVFRGHAEDGLQVVQPGLEVSQPGLEFYSKPGSSVVSSWDEKNDTAWVVHPRNDGPRERRILGLRLSTFCLLVALIGVIIAAILAGVLASKAHCHATTSGSNIPTTTTTTTTITASPSSTASPTSQCASQAGQNWTSSLSHLKYTRVCNTYLDSSNTQYQNLFTAYQPSLDTCVAMCDSYNYWTKSTNMTVAVWNWAGKSNQTPGTCWCVQIDGGYKTTAMEGQDSALRAGSFAAGALSTSMDIMG